MAALTSREAAQLSNVTERAVQLAVEQGKYRHWYTKGRGRGGKVLQIDSESFFKQNPEAQARYYGQEQDAEHDIYLSLTADQRKTVDFKLSIVTQYGEHKRTYHKSDKLCVFLDMYNNAHPEQPLSKRQLNHWEKKYRQEGINGLVDRRGGYNKGCSSIPDDVWDIFKFFMSKPGNPSAKSCYEMTKTIFPELDFPHFSSFQRKWAKEETPYKILINEGEKAFEDKCMPHNIIDKTTLCSNEWWIADHHVFDVLCVDDKGNVFRPWGCFWQDWRSGYIVSHMISPNAPNSDLILDSFTRACRACGMPDNVKLDNGKDFKAYDLFNNKFPLSLSQKLGIHVSRALPYNAKAKPIERSFGTLEGFDKHLDAYIGNAPHKRPEHMNAVNKKLKDKAMPYEAFLEYIANTVKVYNNKPHSGDGMNNQSPYDVYTANFIRPMRIVHDNSILNLYLQRTSKPLTVGRNGIKLPQTKFYYDDEKLFKHFGKKVYARFDIGNVKQVYIYSEQDEFICIAKSKELCTLDMDISMEVIRANEKLKAQRRKMIKDQIPKVNVPTIEEIVASRASQGKVVNFQDVKNTVTMVDSTKRKHAKAIQAEQQRQANKELCGNAPTALGISEEELDERLYQLYKKGG